ncbi:MAG: hypothetical protein MJ041_01680 [Acidaminococcaceae bacterium]|nr:hypothetical protein [Acidaminococcaceae bacterium]
MASYPKPLARKTLEKRYQAFAPEKREFLTRFFTAAANLYGLVYLEELHRIYEELMRERKARGHEDKNYVEGITWDEFVEFSAILRRDGEVAFYVYELTEFAEEEENDPKGRLIIYRDLVSTGRYKLDDVGEMFEQQGDKDYYIPMQFLDYERHVVTPAEKKLKKFLENLKSVAQKVPLLFNNDEHEDAPYVYNKFKGSYLKNIRSVIRRDEVLVQGIGAEKMSYADRRRIFNADGSYRTFAEQMLSMIYDTEQDPFYITGYALKFYFGELERMGVELSNKQEGQLLNLITEYHNTLRLRSNRGFQPGELFRTGVQSNPNAVPQFLFGNGYKEMIRNGDLNLEELRQGIFDDGNLSLPLKKSILDGLKELEKDL